MDAFTRKALVTGLMYAQLLRAHFPEAYISLAADKVSWSVLYGISGMFLTLAHQKLLALDFSVLAREGMGQTIKPSDPSWAMTSLLSSPGARDRLVNVFKSWLEFPLPRVYGLGRDLARILPLSSYAVYQGQLHHGVEHGYNTSRHALTMLLWQLVSGGPWEVARVDDIQKFAAQLPIEDMVTAMRMQPPLAPETPMARLCARLDRDQPHGIKQLGGILAYTCGKTSNPYADWSPEEIRQRYDMAVDLDWRRSASAFAEERQQQKAAKNLAAAYSRLDSRLYRSPELIGQLGQAIRTTAGELLRDTTPGYRYGDSYDPNRLTSIILGEL